MMQIITDFRIQKIDYTNSNNFPSYETNENTILLNNKNVINNLEDFQRSNSIIILGAGHDHTFTGVKYIYAHEVENKLFSVNANTELCCEYLFNGLSSTLTADFTILNPDDTESIKIEYYILS